MLLIDLKPGEKAYITKVKGRGSFRKRILEMGFIKGQQVEYIQQAPLNDPIIFKILNYEVSLRKSEASLIEVQYEPISLNKNQETLFIEGNNYQNEINKSNIVHVALVGNPNSGKTTLFNYCTGLAERVGNYSGVTVDLKKGVYKYKGYIFDLVDLPGTYSLSAYSPEEIFVRNYLMNEFPDIIINVVDASNLERNLYLTTQLIDMDLRTVMALNMYDELQKSGDNFNYNKLSKMIGIPIVPTVSNRGRGIINLFDEIIELYEDKHSTYRHIHIHYGQNIETAIEEIQEELKKNKSLLDRYSSRFISLKLLENDTEIQKLIENCPNASNIKDVAHKNIIKLEKDFQESTETIIADAKYGFISGALEETYKKNKNTIKSFTKKVDKILINKILGLPIFFAILWLIFEATFYLGGFPVEWIEGGIEVLNNWLKEMLPTSILKDLLTDGIIQGVGSVMVFLPNIMLLFLFISIMEDTGYMARAAFIMDKVMHKMGLHGKSFIPMFMGFGCNVPAIMATRTIESKNDRLITILVNPLMSCSARLPIYVLFAGTFFSKYAGLAIFIIYIFGIVLAAILSITLKKFIFKKTDVPFVMELPPYRIPTLRNLIKHMWHKAKQYLKKMSGIILTASIIIWSLSYFPTSLYTKKTTENIEKIIKNENIPVKNKESLENILLQLNRYQIENSYIGIIGKNIEPIMMPLGFDWRITISLIAGISGKEVVISTLSVLFNQKQNNEGLLSENLKQAKNINGEYLFTLPVIAAFLTFVLIYFPCVAVIASIKKETSNWKWSIYVIIFSTILAYLFSLIIKTIFIWIS